MQEQNSKREAGTLTAAMVSVFWASVVVFALLGVVIGPFEALPEGGMWFRYTFFPGIALLFVLGIALIVLTVRARMRGALKVYLLLTGASAAGFPAAAVLHNVVYGLFILWFGEDFWGVNGGDEAFFFIIAILVCPLGFVVGAIGSIVLFILHRLRAGT